MRSLNVAGSCVGVAIAVAAAAACAAEPGAPSEWSPAGVQALLAEAREHGDARRGAGVFNAAATGCTSCHRVGDSGGRVGPELTAIATCLTPVEIVESLVWPARTVKPEYRAHALVLADGDDVATALTDLPAGSDIHPEGGSGPVRLRHDVPFGHKFAVRPRALGESVVKYGEEIGRATAAITLECVIPSEGHADCGSQLSEILPGNAADRTRITDVHRTKTAARHAAKMHSRFRNHDIPAHSCRLHSCHNPSRGATVDAEICLNDFSTRK